VPLSALMNHSPITYKWQQDMYKSEQGPLRTYADVYVWEFMRGNGLIEMYMNVLNMTEPQHKLWGQVSAWAVANDRILLADSRFIGGQPYKEDVYGYAHFTADNDGLVGVRNPALHAQPFTFTLDEKAGFKNNGMTHEMRVIFPYMMPMGNQFKYGDKVFLPKVERDGVVVMEFRAAPKGSVPVLRPERVEPAQPETKKISLTSEGAAAAAEYEITVPAGAAYSLTVIARAPSYKDQSGISASFTLNGAPAEPKTTKNHDGYDGTPPGWEISAGWIVYELPLKEGKNTVSLKVNGAPGGTEAWVFAEMLQDDTLPQFVTGLPAAWKAAARSEWKLF